MMTLKKMTFAASALLACCCLNVNAQKPPVVSLSKPNVLFILTDQWRAQALGYAGDPNVQTPRLDKLAEEGVNFNTTISVCAICTPYRASLLTGRFPLSTGMYDNDLYLPAEELTMGELFKEAGYHTAYIGKWHLDAHGRNVYIPPERRQGFDYWKVLDITHNYPRSHYYDNNDPKVKMWDGYDAYAQTKDAQAYIRKHANGDKPFLFFLSFGGPHFPHKTAPKELKSLYPPESLQLRPNVQFAGKYPESKIREELQGYYGHCTAIDKCVGDLLDTLDELGIADNTIVIFTSDHGEMMGSHGIKPGQKLFPYDEANLVPFLFRYPPLTDGKARKVKTPLNTPDILPTLLALTGLEIPDTIEGEDLSILFREPGKEIDRAALTMQIVPQSSFFNPYRGVRTARYWYAEEADNGEKFLFDCERDPYQMNNLAGKPEAKELQAKMAEQLKAELIKVGDYPFKGAEHYKGHLDRQTGVPLKGVERSWLGPEYWANPMMDWQLKEGRLVCTQSGANHDVQLTTVQLAAHDGTLSMKVRTGMDDQSRGEAFLGFKFSITGHNPEDNRANWFNNEGLHAGVMPDGRLLLGRRRSESKIALSALTDLTLALNVECIGNRAQCTLNVFPGGQADGKTLASLEATLAKKNLSGNVAIACEVLNAKDVRKKRSLVTGWFSDWEVSGTKLKHQQEQVIGPILWTQYSLSHGRLKLLTHLVPLSEEREHPVAFEIKNGDNWETLKTVHMDKLTRTALFEFDSWDAKKDIEYRVVYKGPGGRAGCVSWSGLIRKEPLNRKDIALAVFTGLKDTAFPNSDLTATVRKHDPDIMFFSGDQIYESNGGYRPVIPRSKSDLDRATLNYLPKFWLWGLSFRELLKDRPSILTTDDHDVYSNDLWGRGGIPNNGDRNTGGYVSHPLWVNMVEHTQMGHLPKPPDPTPLPSGINVHYCHVLYGGLSLAVLEDRKFKSAPAQALEKPIGHTDMKNLESIKSSDFDPKDLDKPGLKLLGKRQERFLEQWADEWQGVEFKAVLSGSPFANVTHGYGDLVADLDANGWPQTARNRALRIIQGADAVMAHGDLHIASLHQHGIDDFRDGPWSYCSPSSCATSLRVWTPPQPGQNRNPGAPKYTGDFIDGIGNRISIEAVLNPDHPFGQDYREDDGSILDHKYLRYSGFGILRFARQNHTVTFESWPIYDAETPLKKHQQHPGWPKTVTIAER